MTATHPTGPTWRQAGAAIVQAVRERRGLWLLIAVAFVAVYYLGLQLAMILRFGGLPNYGTVYDLIGNYGLILAGTPAWSDALTIMADEPLLEIGYKHPEYGIAEWALFVIPPKLLMVTGLGFLLATFAVTALRPMGRAGAVAPAVRTPPGMAAAGVGGAMVATSNATLVWVTCSSAPTWVVLLSMLGLSVRISDTLEPFGLSLTLAGLLALAAGTLLQARARWRVTQDTATRDAVRAVAPTGRAAAATPLSPPLPKR
jgi:hypothetical protein